MGIFIYGKSLKEIFKNATFALRRIIGGRKKLNPEGERKINLVFEKIEIGLFLWLSELLFFYDSEFLLPINVKMMEIGKNNLDSTLNVGKLGGTPQNYIKAITLHRINIENRREILRARIILDL